MSHHQGSKMASAALPCPALQTSAPGRLLFLSGGAVTLKHAVFSSPKRVPFMVAFDADGSPGRM